MAETLQQTIARLQAENAALKTKALKVSALSCRVSAKGALSVYGLGRWPVTLYKSQWPRLLAFAEDIQAFLLANDSTLKAKGDE